MDIKYWNSMAVKYEEEIFSSIGSDKHGVIPPIIKKYASKDKVACDFGCGIGHYLPLMKKIFGKIHAYDISPELVNEAMKRNEGAENISFYVKDLADKDMKLPRADFAISANVFIMEPCEIRQGIIENIAKSVKKGGGFVVVVPSLESSLYVNSRLFEWNLEDGMDQKQAINNGMRALHGSKGSVSDGLILIDGVVTKHYLKEELEVFLNKNGFEVKDVKKVEYEWTTEFENPPDWLDEPLPWDWVAESVRK